jgi:hypothetical protein
VFAVDQVQKVCVDRGGDELLEKADWGEGEDAGGWYVDRQ